VLEINQKKIEENSGGEIDSMMEGSSDIP